MRASLVQARNMQMTRFSPRIWSELQERLTRANYTHACIHANTHAHILHGARATWSAAVIRSESANFQAFAWKRSSFAIWVRCEYCTMHRIEKALGLKICSLRATPRQNL